MTLLSQRCLTFFHINVEMDSIHLTLFNVVHSKDDVQDFVLLLKWR